MICLVHSLQQVCSLTLASQCSRTHPLLVGLLQVCLCLVSKAPSIKTTRNTLSLVLGLSLNSDLLHHRHPSPTSKCRHSLTGRWTNKPRPQRCSKTNKRWLACTNRPSSRFFSIETSTLNRRCLCERTYWRKESRFLSMKKLSNSRSVRWINWKQSKIS